MQIDKTLYNEINDYCKENGIKTRDFIHKILQEAFLIEKYGDKPFFMQEKNIETKQLSEIKENKITENKDENLERLDVVLKVAEKTFGSNLSTVTPDNNMDTTIIIPEEWFKPKEKEGEGENIKPIVKRKRKLS